MDDVEFCWSVVSPQQVKILYLMDEVEPSSGREIRDRHVETYGYELPEASFYSALHRLRLRALVMRAPGKNGRTRAYTRTRLGTTISLASRQWYAECTRGTSEAGDATRDPVD